MAAVTGTRNLLEALKLRTNDSDDHAWIDSTRGLVFGRYPYISAYFDFASECLVAEEKPDVTVAPPKASPNKEVICLLHLAPRVTEVYNIEIEDKIYRVGSATQALLRGLELVEEKAPGTLEKMSDRKGRTKRHVASRREDLYELKSQERYAQQIKNGYWVGTNNKGHEALSVLRSAAKTANLRQFKVERSAT